MASAATLDKLRREIFQFIRESTSKEFFARAKASRRSGSYWQLFATYDDFLRDQWRVLNLVSEAQLERYRIAIVDTLNGMYDTYVTDNRVLYPIDGFFLMDGRLIFLGSE